MPEEESRHCVRVLRLNTGDKIRLIDGNGGFYEAEITDNNPKKCVVTILKSEKEVGKRDWLLHIAIAPTKNMDRLEWFVEKATEIGIDEISLIICNNNERSTVKNERLNKVAVAAIKQSIKAYLPKIHETLDIKSFITSIADFKGGKYIAHCRFSPSTSSEKTNILHLKNKYSLQLNALVLIGPEGDFTQEEVNFALANGFIEVSFGDSRLRTETAALYACTLLNILNEK